MLYTRNMASESFLAVATVTNVEQSSADYTVNADAVQLLESVEALNQEFEEEEFNLEALRQITDAISRPPVMNSINTGHETASIASSKRGKGKGRNSKKATQEQQHHHHHHQQQQQQGKECAAVPDNTSLLFQNSGVAAEYVPSQTMDFIQNNNISPVQHMPLSDPQLGLNISENRSQALFSPANLQCNSITPSQVFSPSGAQMAEVMFTSKPADDNTKNTGKPNYLNQCKNRLRKYQSEAMRDFSDLVYAPFAFETSFESLEGQNREFVFRKKVFDCMESLHKHACTVRELEKAIYSSVLPLKEKVGGVLLDNQNFNSVTPTRINNALKRKRLEELESLRDRVITQEVIDQLRPPKSYCLKQWPSLSSSQQFEKLNPLFEAFLLMRQDTELKLHTYAYVQNLEQFKGLLFTLKEKEPRYYEELTRYLVTAGKTRLRWYKEFVNGEMDEMTYVELCKK